MQIANHCGQKLVTATLHQLYTTIIHPASMSKPRTQAPPPGVTPSTTTPWGDSLNQMIRTVSRQFHVSPPCTTSDLVNGKTADVSQGDSDNWASHRHS